MVGNTGMMDEWVDPPVEPLLAEPVKPGQRLGSNYVVGERLGRGAMGVVHEADAQDGRQLAVKFLRAELASDHKTVARFLQERQIFRKVNHPNVVRVYDLVAEGDDLAIVMERVSGGDLKQRIIDRSLDPRQSVIIAAGIAAGLQAIHGASVVHRDLKPANILLTDELSPKISDFGISRLVTEAMTRTSATIGTPIYMAPEAADQRGAHAPADVYALGIMLFELLVGQPPFAEGGTFAVLRAHAMDIPPRVEGVPAGLTDLIARMLDKEPAQRPLIDEVQQSLAALAEQIDPGSRPVAVPPVGSGQQGVESGEVTGPRSSGDPTSSPTGAAGAAGAGAAVGAFAAAAAGNPLASPVPADSAETMVGAEAAADGMPVIQSSAVGGGIGDSGETMVSSAAGHEPTIAGATAVAGNDSTVASPAAGFGGLDGAPQPPSSDEGVPFIAGAPPGTRTTGGIGSLFPNRVPRRVLEAGLAVGSLVAVLIVVGLVLNSGDDSGTTEIGSGGVSTTDPAGAGTNPVDGGGGDDDGPTQFSSSLVGDDGGDAGDDGAGGVDPSPSTTTGGDDGEGSTSASTATTEGTTSTSASSSTTEESTTSTSTTTTTRPTTSSTTTTSTTTTTTTTTTQPVATPIRIISGPTVNQRNPTSFQFNYSTNDVCGTGSFTVTEVDTGISAGSFTGDNVCFGPQHGGFPGFQGSPQFSRFNIKPETTYRVTVTVRGTSPGPGDSLPAGSGSDSATFQVTTPAA